MDKGHQTNLGDAVKLWPTPRVSMANGPSAKEIEAGDPKRRLETAVHLWQTPVADDSVEREKGKWNSRGEPRLSAQVKLWPTPTKQDASNNGGPSQHKRNSLPLNTAVLYPTPSVQEPGRVWPTPTAMTGGEGVAPSHLDGGHGWNTAAAVNAAAQNTTGKLNPQWVAWLMGYPTEYLNSVRWETPSSRRSRKKSEKPYGQ
jgi:hypothetical protein